MRSTLLLTLAILGLFSATPARAGLLQGGSEYWSLAPGNSGFFSYGFDGPGGTMTPTYALALSMDGAQNSLIVTGQVTYSFTIATANTCRSLLITEDFWRADALIDPAYSGPTQVSVAASGFLVGTAGVDYRLGIPNNPGAGFSWGATADAGAVGDQAWCSYDPGGVWKVGGAQSNFNESAIGSSPFIVPVGHNGIAYLMPWQYFTLEIQPTGGATYFSVGTHSLVVDYPVSLTLTPVPEPCTVMVMAAGLGVLTKRRRRGRRPVRKRR